MERFAAVSASDGRGFLQNKAIAGHSCGSPDFLRCQGTWVLTLVLPNSSRSQFAEG